MCYNVVLIIFWRDKMHAKIISVVNQKGGSGKSTITMNLGATLAIRHSKKVLIIDGDIQASATKWASCAQDGLEFPCSVISLASAGNKAHRTIMNFIKDYDVIIVDCPPSTEAGFNASSLLVSDLAIIPIKPGSTDLWAVEGILKLIDAATITNEKLVTKAIPNMCEPNKNLSKNIIEYFVSEESIQLFSSRINYRSIYGEVALTGESAYTSKNSKAKNELALFSDEVLQTLNIESKFK